MRSKSTSRAAEAAPEYLRTPEILRLFGMSAPTWRRLQKIHDDFPCPIRFSAKLSIWNVEEVRAWFKKREAESAARPKDTAGMPAAPVPSLRRVVDSQRKQQRTNGLRAFETRGQA